MTTLTDRPAVAALTAADVMRAPVVVTRAGDDVEAAWSTMLRHGVRHLVVVDGSRCCGVVGDRRLSLARPPWGGAPGRVGDLLPRWTACVLPSTSLARTAALMVEDGTDAVAVVQPDGTAVGIVTLRDVAAAAARGAA